MYTRSTRRQFLTSTAAAGAALTLPWYFGNRTAFAFSQSTGLQKFVQPLRGIGPAGIPVAAPDAFAAPVTGATHYSITIGQFTDQLHPDLGPTTLWGYNPKVPLGGTAQSQRHLGGIIVAQRGTPIQITYNDAPAPFPSGDLRNDYFPGSPNPILTTSGFGPNTRQIMRFNVVPATSKDRPLRISHTTDLTPGLAPFLVPPDVAVQSGVLHLPPGVRVRYLTLNEDSDGYGRLIQFLGTNKSVNGSFGRAYEDPATETPEAGSTEVWQIANLTGDTHPIHFHLVNVQILGRQPFNVVTYNGVPSYTGRARGPERTELGWKETVRMNPGEVTTVIMRFDLPKVSFPVPSSPRTGGHEYVWHCHILDHEEHDMMRPLIVKK